MTIAPSKTEMYRGFEITAFEVKRGFKFLVRESGELVWSSRPIRTGVLDDMIVAGKAWIDGQYPATLGVHAADAAVTSERFGG